MKKQKRNCLCCVIVLAVLCLAGGIIFGVSALNAKQQTAAGEAAETNEQTPEGWITGKVYARIDVRDYGSIIAELDADTAPVTVNNFVGLVNDGFYNGLTFHRIISGFMIQGGDPNGNGSGGSGKRIKGEFASNGVKNDLKHVRGTISMARSSMPDSASSQFFIMHQDAPSLDGRYAAFGTVLSGMEVVDAICKTVPVMDGNGTVARENQPRITAITMITAEEAHP